MLPTYRKPPHKQECTPIIYRSWPWALSELYLLISCTERRLTSEADKANRTRGVKSVCMSVFEQAGGLSGSKVKRGWWVGQWWWSGESCSANTACCHKHTRYMNSHKSVRETEEGYECERGRGRQRDRWRAHERERVKEGGPRFTHSVVICSSCFHTGGILRLLLSI